MKRNPYFVLRNLSGVPYLLPYGQSIASHHRGTMLNETGVFLWEQLETPHTAEELISLCADYYGATEEEVSELTKDLMPFLDSLVALGAILSDKDPWDIHASCAQTLQIAGFTLCLEGPAEIFSEKFTPFALKEPVSQCDMTISAFAGICPYQNPGNAILRNSMMSILDCGDYYEIQLHANQQLKECILKKDASHACFYYRLPQNDLLKEELFHGIREVFLYLAGLHGMVAIHSTSILYRGRAWLFSGHSGMGKSTHANLWKESFGTPVLNGDLNLLALQDGQPVIHGIPWCGTSEISDTETHPLGGITLLNRAPTNFVTELTKDQQILLVDQRLISHSWTKELFDRNLDTITKIASEILICKLSCTKDPEAAKVMKDHIDLTMSS